MTPLFRLSDRRTFLKSSSTLVGAAALASRPFAADTDEDVLRIALIGCGGRGTGAANQALAADPNTRLVAVADAFRDRIDSSLAALETEAPGRIDVPEDRKFVGFDAYARALDVDVDVVILATPPGFRPAHFEAAVERGRHVFMEKPVAVDGPGVRRVLAAAKKAKSKNLKVGVGLQRHHEARYLETVRRIREGAIGNVLVYRCYWNSGGVWVKDRLPDMTEMEYQMRNWYYFNWLCGDHIVEQHIHNLDVCNWIEGDYPTEARGQGGRQVRTGREFGEIYDHHFVEFSYASGAKMFSQCRHQQGCWNSVSEHAHGTLGTADVSRGVIKKHAGGDWMFEGDNPNPYQVEHDRLIAAIRSDQPHMEAENGARSTLTAILGRMATYSGKVVTFDEALNSELALVPTAYTWDAEPPTTPDSDGRYPIPMPGISRAF